MFMCRVVNDPYDVLGCWYNDHYFLSGTMTVEGLNLLVSILWLSFSIFITIVRASFKLVPHSILINNTQSVVIGFLKTCKIILFSSCLLTILNLKTFKKDASWKCGLLINHNSFLLISFSRMRKYFSALQFCQKTITLSTFNATKGFSSNIETYRSDPYNQLWKTYSHQHIQRSSLLTGPIVTFSESCQFMFENLKWVKFKRVHQKCTCTNLSSYVFQGTIYVRYVQKHNRQQFEGELNNTEWPSNQNVIHNLKLPENGKKSSAAGFQLHWKSFH